MDNKNNLTPSERIIRIASVMLAISVAGIIFALVRVESVPLRIAILIAAGASSTFALLLILLVIYTKSAEKHKRNYFLYDRKQKREMPVESITFELVRSRVLDYMMMFKRGKRLYVGELFEKTPEQLVAIKPLLCYELLYELSESKDVGACKIFLGYGSECLKIFSDHLMNIRDFELCEKLTEFFSKFGGGEDVSGDFCEYISEQRSHIQSSMMSYTRDNIEKFTL